MRKKSRIAAYALGGISLTVLVGSLAFAAVPELRGWGHGGPGFRSFLQDMDADGDGSVSRSEIAAFNATRAAEIDADKDGQVTVAELETFQEAQRQKHLAERLAAMDSDGDGKVTVAELESASAWQIARLDRDGDGTIEPGELGRHHGHDRGPGDEPGHGPQGPDAAPTDPEN